MDTLKLSAALRDAQGRIIGRAWEDKDFQKTLMADPRAAIKQVAGIDIPAGVTVKVVQETDDTLYLVLHRSPLSRSEGELSDAELAGVAGGNRGIPTEPGYPDPSCQ